MRRYTMATYHMLDFLEKSSLRDFETGEYLYPDLTLAFKKLGSKVPSYGIGSQCGGYVLICDHCGDVILTNTRERRFCSDECRSAYYMERRGKPIKLPVKSPLVFGKVPKGMVTKTCECCGRHMLVNHASVKLGRGMFCSKACRHKMNLLSSIKVKCNQCNTTFLVKTSRFAKFCSYQCALVMPQPANFHVRVVTPEDVRMLEFNDKAYKFYKDYIDKNIPDVAPNEYPMMSRELLMPFYTDILL